MTFEAFPVLYVKATSPRCADAVSFLDEHGISYRLRDVGAEPESGVDLRRLAKHAPTPTLDWHGQVLAGFTIDELASFLKEQEVEMEDS